MAKHSACELRSVIAAEQFRLTTLPDQAVEYLNEMIDEQEQVISISRRTLARRLSELGDDMSAATLIKLAETPIAHPNYDADPADAGKTGTPAALLLTALSPLERLSEILEIVLTAPPDAETQSEAQDALTGVVAHIARIGRRIELLEAG